MLESPKKPYHYLQLPLVPFPILLVIFSNDRLPKIKLNQLIPKHNLYKDALGLIRLISIPLQILFKNTHNVQFARVNSSIFTIRRKIENFAHNFLEKCNLEKISKFYVITCASLHRRMSLQCFSACKHWSHTFCYCQRFFSFYKFHFLVFQTVWPMLKRTIRE